MARRSRDKRPNSGSSSPPGAPPKRRSGPHGIYDDEFDAARQLEELHHEFWTWPSAWRDLGVNVAPSLDAPCVVSRRALDNLRRVPQARRERFAQGLAEALNDPTGASLERVRYSELDLYRWRCRKRRALLHACSGRWCLVSVFVPTLRNYPQHAARMQTWRFYLYAADGLQLTACEDELEPREARQWAQSQLGKKHQGKRVEQVRMCTIKR